MKEMRDRDAVNGLGGMAGPSTDDHAAQTALAEDIPHRFALAREDGDRLNATAIGRGLGEAVNAMFEGALAGGDGGPQHGRERGSESGELRHRPAFDEAPDVGHLARVHQRMDDLPVGGVPADEEDFGTGGHDD
jgi:hypothetical protein